MLRGGVAHEEPRSEMTSSEKNARPGGALREHDDRLAAIAADLADLRRVTGEEDLDLRARIRAVEEDLASLEQELRDRLETLAATRSNEGEQGGSAIVAGESRSPATPRARRARRARRLTRQGPEPKAKSPRAKAGVKKGRKAANSRKGGSKVRPKPQSDG